MKEKLLKLLIKYIDLPGLIAETLDEVLEPALDKVVEDSANPFDNMVKAAVMPVLKKELKDLVAAKWAELQA